MKQRIIIDTGPLVAAINRRDTYHTWALEELKDIQKPLLTCEAVISEASFLLQRVHGGQQALLSWLETGLMVIDFQLHPEVATIRALMLQYESVPMSFADACLVRMAELILGSTVFTLDSDFDIYRINRNQIIPILIPTQQDVDDQK